MILLKRLFGEQIMGIIQLKQILHIKMYYLLVIIYINHF